MVENIVAFLQDQIAQFGVTPWGNEEIALRDELAHVLHDRGLCPPEGTQIPAGCVVSATVTLEGS